MRVAARHLSASELEEGLADVKSSPTDSGRLEAIFVRPKKNERSALSDAHLSVEGGVEGDRWSEAVTPDLPDDDPHRDAQISLMNSRILQQIAGGNDADTMCLAGDNLIVDFDLSETNLPSGTRLVIGENVVLELTALPHTGCRKFADRYGKEAVAFIDGVHGKPLNLRGRYARVISGGTVHLGDVVRKV